MPAGQRWGDPRNLLIQPAAWKRLAPTVTRALQLPNAPKSWIDHLGSELDRAWHAAAAAVEKEPSIRLEPDGRRDRVHLTRLDAIDEASSTARLRESAFRLMPTVDLPEVLREVERWTGFGRAFSASTGGQSRIADLELSICAVLLAQACNVGYRPVVSHDHPALTAARLDYVANTYVRPETIAAANARLVDYQATIGIVRQWGDGTLASADGVRFVVPVESLHAGRNPKYFATGHGVVFYNWLADTYSGLNSIVLPGTKKDSQYLLDGIVDNPTALEPREITADTAADSDLIHGLCKLLGYQFSPRLADLPDRRFWRLARRADYRVLNRVAVNRLDPDLIVAHWPDVLRVAGTLHTAAATASEVIRALQRNGQPTPLARVICEIGRAVRTITMLKWITDDTYRRRILVQLNRQESRHALARDIFHGRRGQLYQSYRTGQENQLGALGLVLNVICLFNTRYLDRAVAALSQRGDDVADDDLAHLSPLTHQNVNLQGRYVFTLPKSVTAGELRPPPRRQGPVALLAPIIA